MSSPPPPPPSRPRTALKTARVVGLDVRGRGRRRLGYCSVFGCTVILRRIRAARRGGLGRASHGHSGPTPGERSSADATWSPTPDRGSRRSDRLEEKGQYSHECSVVDSRVVMSSRSRGVADGLPRGMPRSASGATGVDEGGLDGCGTSTGTREMRKCARYGAAGGRTGPTCDAGVVVVPAHTARGPSSQPTSTWPGIRRRLRELYTHRDTRARPVRTERPWSHGAASPTTHRLDRPRQVRIARGWQHHAAPCGQAFTG